ncbi:Protein of unknown function DUF2087 [Ruminiclostridium papyrosolvens DSM 2782]|uniref:DUF2087 domain-containing protein n=1 Tax=Ruminiclostridium papyrosolvens DSM 2782 TaxID=588581 RepID=F1TER1_9FIRM|nr:DUF2087 domain-containing protein [Ruminiclostridium papyrosolvens]EGD47227.1 Protein of unknown function DUF2087 [Ruminiclostridium papyrosolvens DSM 2782]WES36266.1 DUF2087 domain-containing protein [Ruminiclostridium papyrosolvens DSM 2782]
MIDSILKLSLDEIKKGYSYNQDKGISTCLTCGKTFESGEMFSIDGRFYDASKAVQIHIQKEHEDMLDMLTSFDKKYTGITENQKELLLMIYKGMSDNDIAKKTGVAPATVRRQRFVFREKAKQAKLFLAIFEIVENKYLQRKEKAVNDELINVHAGAKMIDDRYLITKSEEDKIIESLFESLEPLRLKIFSSKEKKKVVILSKIAEQFEKKRKYSEKEVNEILKGIYSDFATIRRYLIEYGYMERTKDCREYWLK